MMKREPKARWTAREIVRDIGDEVGIIVTIHNLAELGFKYVSKTRGEKYGYTFYIPIKRYLAMSEEDKRRECEKYVQGLLAMLAELEKNLKRVEETAKIISKEIVSGELVVSQVQEEKPLKIIDKELVQKIAIEAKKLVYESPEIQKALIPNDALKVAERYGLDEQWVSTVVYLLLEEIALKQWLRQKGRIPQELNKKNYDKLLTMLEMEFKKMGKPVSPRDISKFFGERVFRNRVLHDGYNPNPVEAKETKEMAISLLEFLKQN